jgi:hypothetical protein
METFKEQYVKIPNWFFDEILPVVPQGFSTVLLAIFRNTLGWQSDQSAFTLAELVKRLPTGNKESTSRWLYVMQMVGWIWYVPAANGSGDGSTIKLRTWPDRAEAKLVARAIATASAAWEVRAGMLGFLTLLHAQLGCWDFAEILDRYQPEAFLSYPEGFAGPKNGPAKHPLVRKMDRR